ncbi:MAG: protoporphyrinogen IX oxidase [Bacteroidetes bacterium]|nr:MAG: protoporphyrinogen IX oxidase [Bacteroidota bacterium]
MNPYILALHIIFVVTWFAGLFYIVRLFVYHAEAEKKSPPEKDILQKQYKLMEKRLWYGIACPSLIGTYIFGGWLLYEGYGLNIPAWLLLKLSFVFGLTLYHVRCHVMFLQFQKGVVKYSGFMLRIWNELATIFLVAIVFIVELKDTFSYVKGALGLVLFIATIFLAIRIYRKGRKGN